MWWMFQITCVIKELIKKFTKGRELSSVVRMNLVSRVWPGLVYSEDLEL
jgi:hypothetical protein